MIRQIFDADEKSGITKQILDALPEWFAVSEANEEYAKNSRDKIFFAAFDGEKAVGFIYLQETSIDTVELHVMGVLNAYQNRGIGRLLFQYAKKCATANGYSFMQVKTVQMGTFKSYDKTNLFYKKMGFKELEVFPLFWDKNNPCQVYIMTLN